jgi:branched-chain amino acid transport system ATP-binding protein
MMIPQATEMMITVDPRAIEAVGIPQTAQGPSRPIAPLLLEARHLRKAFGGHVVLDGVDLDLRQGDVVLLRGENGSGKTTLLNILTGNLEPDAGAIRYLADGTPRAYRFPRRWWQDLNPFDHFTPEFVTREGMSRTWQDVRLFGSQSLRDNIAVAEPVQPGENPDLALLAPGQSTRREKMIDQQADAMLARLGLAGRETSSADKISLGQSKRVAIARAVAAGARVLFLDEPLAGLDRQGITDILALLESLVREHDVTLVIVEHVFNQPHLRHLVTLDWLLAGGSLAVSRPASDLRPLRSGPSSTIRPPWFDLLTSDDAEIVDEVLPRGAFLTRIRRGDRFQRPPMPVLEICDLVVKRGARTVIGLDDQGNPTGFSLTLFQGEIAVLQAPNGWGKSTLFETITGTIEAHSGSVCLEGRTLNGLAAWERVGHGLRALPSGGHTFPNLRTREALRLSGSQAPTINVEHLGNGLCSSLSGGQRQLLAVAASSGFIHTRAALFDEPFSMLDYNVIPSVASQIIHDAGASVLLFLP